VWHFSLHAKYAQNWMQNNAAKQRQLAHNWRTISIPASLPLLISNV